VTGGPQWPDETKAHMHTGFFPLPEASRFALRNGTAPRSLIGAAAAGEGDLCRVDLLVADGRIAAVEPGGSLPAALGPDLDGSMVLPGLIDIHTHLDKGHIWPRQPNLTGDFLGAAIATSADSTARWTPEDMRARMDFALATAYAHGVVAIRTHLDSMGPDAAVAFRVFGEAREAWAGRVDLQASSIAMLDIFLTDEGRELADIVAQYGGNLGTVTSFCEIPPFPRPPEFDVAMTNLFALARERNLDVDLHVDETSDHTVLTLLRVAQLATRVNFAGKIVCGHCCSLALQTDETIRDTLDACFDAGISIVSLPACNMFLQDRRAGLTPRWRGVPPLQEMKARGLQVAVGGDNVRDPYYAYGDHDMLDTFTLAVKILQLDCPIGDWIDAATRTPASIMRLGNRGALRVAAPADLIVLRARNYSELLARHQSDRVVLRAGRAIDTALPDYRQLDSLLQTPPA
jgi:cytosine deaminase